MAATRGKPIKRKKPAKSRRKTSHNTGHRTGHRRTKKK